MLPVFTLSCFITAISSLIFGCFVVLSNLKIGANRLWFLTTSSIALWSLSLGMEISSPNYPTALLWNKILNVGAIFIPIFYYHFVILFLDINKDIRERIILAIGYCLAFFLIVSDFFTKLLVKGVPPAAGFNYWIEVGPLYYLFFGLFVAYLSWSALLLLQRRKKVSGIQRRQIDYVLIALLMGAGGGVTNFFPQLFNIYPFGNYFVMLYVIFISYAVLKHNLFNVKVIATELLTFAMWVLLLIKFLLSDNIQDFLLNGGLLLAVIIFGILLIRSVLREIRQREKIEKAEKEVERALEAEKKANDTLELFMTGLQHDVKGYLTPIISGSPSLLKGDGVFSKQEKDGIYLNKDGVRMIEIFERSALAARDQAEDFLAIAKFRTGKPVVALESSVEIGSMLDGLVNSFKSEAKQKGIAIKFEKPDKKFFVSADETKLKSALRNVIGNSVKYTREGWVLVDLEEKEKNKILIKVQDTGIGILPEKIAALFSSPFERAEEAKNTASGAGFGLYFASLIIGLHNGRIWAESKGNDKGSTFFIELPVL